jgi:hypothetical protein
VRMGVGKNGDVMMDDNLMVVLWLSLRERERERIFVLQLLFHRSRFLYDRTNLYV